MATRKITAAHFGGAWSACALAMCLLGSGTSWASDVVAVSHGTRVNTEASGRAVVLPSGPVGDVSHNIFSRFDVDRAGVVFANQSAKARTIVAEVRSQASSRIAGPVEVEGPRANLILANQNGLQIDGGSFVNFGSVALTTGQVRLRDQVLGSGRIQRYVDVSTAEGGIDIGPGGLSANLIRLELIAKRIGIEGTIQNSYSSATAKTRLVAGESVAQFDTVASPSDNLTPWVYYSGGSERTTGREALHIGVGSSVTSGQVEIRVTDKGAGVYNAGDVLASAGDFSIETSGELVQAGGSLRAQGRIRGKVGSLHQQNTEQRTATISAGVSTRIDAEGDIINLGGEIAGHARAGSDDTPYAVMLKAGGTLENRTELGAPQPAVIHGRGDGVRLEAGKGVVSVNARVLANGAFEVVTGGNVRHESLHQAGAGSTRSSEGNWLWRESEVHDDAGQLADPKNLAYWVAEGPITVQGNRIANLGGNIFSNAGKVSFDAATEIVNQAHLVGQTTLKRECVLFLCRMHASTTETLVGGDVLATGAVEMKAGGRILNDGGQVLGQQGMLLDAPDIVARARPIHLSIARDRGLKAWLGDTWARLYAVDQGGSFTAQQGQLILRGRARQEGGRFVAGDGLRGEIEVIRAPYRDPIRIDSHLGILWW